MNYRFFSLDKVAKEPNIISIKTIKMPGYLRRNSPFLLKWMVDRCIDHNAF